ncbi:TPA: thioredoxin fold domain-containing protein [Klebsiella pneumoniae]
MGVFTDITCGFCQKLHSDLQSYLDKGITIKFIAYPRAGMNSMIARNMASVWCADDKPAAGMAYLKSNRQRPAWTPFRANLMQGTSSNSQARLAV